MSLRNALVQQILISKTFGLLGKDSFPNEIISQQETLDVFLIDNYSLLKTQRSNNEQQRTIAPTETHQIHRFPSI